MQRNSPRDATSAAACRIDGAGTNALDSPKILLLSTLFRLPYRVLRCIQATGASIYVLGTPRAKGLAYSRYCEEFFLATSLIDGAFDAGLVEEINGHIERLGINIILAGDGPSTRSLIAIRHLLDVPCFPMPELTQFDSLNDKWQFTALCKSLGIMCPRTRLFLDTEELRREIDRNSLDFPLIAKPLNMDGGVGCIRLEQETARESLSKIFYHPILVQDLIQGEDIGASVYCERGEIRAFLAHRYRRATYSAFFDDAIYNDIAKLMRKTKVDGVFNFDMRRTPDGRIFYLECNPRFFFKMALSMLAGVNFVRLGLSGPKTDALLRLSQPVSVPLLKAMLATLPTPWKLRGMSWSVLRFLLSDPVPYFREHMGLENDAGRFYG